jgi:HNH endonuclease
LTTSKRLRYEVLRRDGNRCRYCGVTADEAKIVVDAVVPEALGGSHKDPANLVAACEPCNSGKTSSSPDAPLVADVAQDALRWSHAIRLAAERIQTDVAGREEAYEQFDAWWSEWHCGGRPAPRPPDWRRSLDNWLAAGLPLDVLHYCITKAMGHSVAPIHTWRYMCGVAWRKVREIQAAAQALANGSGELPELAGSGEDLYWDTIQYLLDFFPRATQSEAEEALAQDEDQPLPGRREQGVLEHAISHAVNSLQWLQMDVLLLLDAIPGGAGSEGQHQARIRLYNERGPTFTKTDFIEWAVTETLRILCPAEEGAEVSPDATR